LINPWAFCDHSFESQPRPESAGGHPRVNHLPVAGSSETWPCAQQAAREARYEDWQKRCQHHAGGAHATRRDVGELASRGAEIAECRTGKRQPNPVSPADTATCMCCIAETNRLLAHWTML